MKVTIDRDRLLKAVAHGQGVIERRNTIPILCNVKLDAAADGRLTIIGTDLDIEVVDTVDAAVSAAGGVTVPAQTLHDILRKLQSGAQVELQTADHDRITLRSGRSRFTLPTLPVDDFPRLSASELQNRFCVPAAQFRRLIDRTRFAISTEETRYYLNGIYLHTFAEGGTVLLRAVATDGHRMAMADVPAPDGAAGMPGIIVPRKTVAEIRKLIDDTDGDVAVGVSETQIRVEVDAACLTSKLIDGTFPNYERVVPEKSSTVVCVLLADLGAAVSRVTAVASERSTAVKITATAKGMLVSARSPEHGEAFDEVDASVTGPAIEIGFNSRYLLDILEQGKGTGATTCLGLTASDAPARISDDSDTGALYVLMPMRVA